MLKNFNHCYQSKMILLSIINRFFLCQKETIVTKTKDFIKDNKRFKKKDTFDLKISMIDINQEFFSVNL